MMPHSESLGQEELNPEQQEAVKAPDGANLVLAGAGSGKTRVLIHRILHLLKAGAPPESILAITFTNKAAGEMKARLAAALGPAARPAWVGTFHAAGARILRAEGAALGISPHFAIMARGESLRLLKREMAAERVNPERYDPRAILERISAHKSAGRPLGNDDGVPFSLESVAAKLLPRYERAVRDAGALDFDDLLALPLRLFQENPDILSRYQRRFSEILVDEYQDTNAVQSRLVKALAGEAPRVFAVGDDDQSIYGWRGADVGNIRRFEADFPGARVYRLERNYRSSGRILQAASAVMANAPGRQEKRLLAQNPEGAPVLYIGAADPDTEAQMIFQRFAALGAGAEIPWGEAAIFYRINTQSRPLEEEARRRRIPYQVVKGQRFFDRAEVQDAAAYLRVLLRPEDESAFARIVNRPPRGLGQVRLQEMAAGGRLDRNVAREALVAGRVRGAAAKALDGLLGLFDELSAKRAGPAQMIGALLAQSGYHAWLREQAERSASPETRQKAARALDGVGEFAAAALAFEERIREEEGIDPGSRDGLARFLEEMALAGEADEMETAGGKLSLMTLHAAKGLEFRAVAIAGVQEGLLPHGRSVDAPESLEEERRLLYVGITRAKAHLLLAWAHERRGGYAGGGGPARPSRFVADLPDALLERAGDHRPRERAERAVYRGRGKSWYEEPEALKPAARESEAPGTPIPQALGPFAPGALVRHPKFGEGVVAARSGTGERAIVTVDFREVGQKQLVLKYAPLEPVGTAVDGEENRTI